MLTRTAALALCPAILLLAACGDYEDASAEAQADTVEIPANEPLTNITAAPVADPNANTNVAGEELQNPEGAAETTAAGTPSAGATPGATGTPAATATPAAAAVTPSPSPTPQQATRTPPAGQ